MDNVVPIRPGIHPITPPVGVVMPAGQAVGDISPWSIIGWLIVGVVVWEGGRYVLRRMDKTPIRAARRR